MSKTDAQRLEAIVRTGRQLVEFLHAGNIDAEKIMTDTVVQWAITTPLYNIGENVYQLSDAVTGRYPDVPWYRVAGMRHRLVHDYEGTNWAIVADTVLNEVPAFIARVEGIIAER